MRESEKIYDDFYKLDSNDYYGIIKFYEQNILFLENKSSFNNKVDFEEFILIQCQYIISLENTGKYKKTISKAERVLQLLDVNSKTYNIDLNTYTTYWSILTSQGISYYKLKQYENSYHIFSRLLEFDQDNDYFKEWMNASQSEKRKVINKYLYFSALLLFLVSFIVESKTYGGLFLILGFVILITGSLNEYFGDKIITWLKKK